MFYEIPQDLDRKGFRDQCRHKEIIREILKENARQILIKEAIISFDGKTKVYVPIIGLHDPHFRFADFEDIGSGSGEEEVGDIVYEEGGKGGSGGPGGEGVGDDYYETDVTIDELAEILFEGMELPNLQQKGADVVDEKIEWKEIRRKGALVNINKRRTIKENIKRNASKGKPQFADLHDKDLRFKSWEETIQHRINAVMFCVMDVSGSISDWQLYSTRTLFFWMVTFLRRKYDNVDIVFINHDSSAKEVEEQHFFTRLSGGGTSVSSAYELALKIIEERFPVETNNIYLCNASDGDNYPHDNPKAVELLNKLCDICNLVAYAELKDTSIYNSSNTLYSLFDQIEHDNFIKLLIRSDDDLYPALRSIFKEKTSV